MEACKSSCTNDDAATSGFFAGGERDRLSALPDCLLHEIMSHMQARQVVQTCVLSTRWRHLWRSVPCIDADQGEFTAAAVAAASVSVFTETLWEMFEDFMDILLSPGNVSIAQLDKFRLRVTSHSSDQTKRGYRWIRRAIKYDDDPAAQGLIQRQGFSSSRSWRIRELHLDNVCLDALFSKHVRSGCPNLEDLELTCCICEFQAITSGSLKKLVMKRCTMIGFREITSPTLNDLVIDGGGNTEDCLLVITAPAAASVFLGIEAYCFPGGFTVRGLTPLTKASVRLRLRALKIDDYLKILDSVPNVLTKLELSDSQVHGECSATFPQFDNLKALELNRCDIDHGFQMLGLFLRNSPNLERLILRHCKYSNDSRKKASSKLKNTKPTSCLNLVDTRCKNLKLTEIIYRDEDIRQLIELLLCISENLPNNCIKLIKN